MNLTEIPTFDQVIQENIVNERLQHKRFMCLVCNKPTLNKCGGCQEVFYCSFEHQKQHWTIHKSACLNSRMASKGKSIVQKKGRNDWSPLLIL